MRNKSVYIAFIAIVLVAIVFGVLNSRNLEQRVSLQENAEILLKVDGDNPIVVTMSDIQELGLEEFKANLKKNGKAPVEYTYSGVLLKNVIESKGINLTGRTHIEVQAVDGYTSAIPMEKVLEDGNVYVAVMREGIPLEGREDDGPGPYQIIISKDKFSQYWCKWAIEVNIK